MTRATPAWAKDALVLAGGQNRFGEPNFRVTWGASLCDWVGGLWTDKDVNGNTVREVRELRWVQKYPMFLNRWIMERWTPPEKYGTPETWLRHTTEWGAEGNIPQLGPYPQRGRYQLACVLEVGTPARFVQLTPTILGDVIRAVIYKQTRVPSLAELKQAQAEKDARWMAESRDYLERPAFNANTFVNVA